MPKYIVLHSFGGSKEIVTQLLAYPEVMFSVSGEWCLPDNPQHFNDHSVQVLRQTLVPNNWRPSSKFLTISCSSRAMPRTSDRVTPLARCRLTPVLKEVEGGVMTTHQLSRPVRTRLL